MLDRLFDRFDKLVVLDLETTGFSPRRDEIIEIGALAVTRDASGALAQSETDLLVRLSPGRRVPNVITQLTGITDKRLEDCGVEKDAARSALLGLLEGESPLLAAYNAQFDLGFVYRFLKDGGAEDALRRARFLDAMTVYRDRRDYPHRLENAVAAYSLTARNTHRASDDALAAFELLKAMDAEKDDLDRYVNLFGYNPKYGVSGLRVSSVRYAPQPYTREKKIYE